MTKLIAATPTDTVEVLIQFWPLFPAAALVLFGAGLVVAGLRSTGLRRGRHQGGPARALAYLYVFRRMVVGLAFVGAGVAWAHQVPWLLAACVCIGIGELLETSYYINVLHWGQRHRLPSHQTLAEQAEVSI